MLITLIRRSLTTQTRRRSNAFSMQEIESKWVDTRLDRVAMAKLGVAWSDAHRYVRQKDLFIARSGKDYAPDDKSRFVKKQTNYKVAYGDILCITDSLLEDLKKRQSTQNQLQAKRLRYKTEARNAEKLSQLLIYENDHILIIDKPCGVPSQQGSGLDPNRHPSIDMLARAYTPDACLVHRLDRATSGLMCVAKSKEMARYLSNAFTTRQASVQKEYLALASSFMEKWPYPQQGVIRQSIQDPEGLWTVQATTQDVGDRQNSYIASPTYNPATHSQELDMVTFFNTVHSVQLQKDSDWAPFGNVPQEGKPEEFYHLMRLELETGKKHQIRLACAHALGSPIVGDFKHGFDSARHAKDLMRRSFKYTKLQERKLFDDGGAILLHSARLKVPVEPVEGTAKVKEFKSQPKGAFKKVMDQMNLKL